MSRFDLDLRAVEEQLPDKDRDGGTEDGPTIVLGMLDGTTAPEEWIEVIDGGDVLVLEVDGDVNERAAGFARDIKEDGGRLVHFKGFLIVTPADIEIDTDRLPG